MFGKTAVRKPTGAYLRRARGPFEHPDARLVKLRFLQCPQGNLAQIPRSIVQSRSLGTAPCESPCPQPLAIQQRRFDCNFVLLLHHRIKKDLNLQPGMCAEHVHRACEDIFDIARCDDAQRDFAIDAAKGEIVDLVAECECRAFRGCRVRPPAGCRRSFAPPR